MTVAETLKGSVEVTVGRVPGLEQSDGEQTPQPTHCVDWHNTSSVPQPQPVLSIAASMVEDH